MRITKELKKAFADKAQELVQRYNPYIARATKYAVGDVPMYLYAGKSMTKEQIDDCYLETALHDMQRGYEERMVGFYDKWYRYSHADEGAAYDIGVRMAADNPKCRPECQYIECQS